MQQQGMFVPKGDCWAVGVLPYKSLNALLGRPLTKALKLFSNGGMHPGLLASALAGWQVGRRKGKMKTEIECSSLSWPQASHVMKPTLSSNSPLSLSSRRLIFYIPISTCFWFCNLCLP